MKSYLHINCSICHVGEGGQLRHGAGLPDAAVGDARALDEVPQHDKFNLPECIVAPGSPRSRLPVLYQRITRRGNSQMPPLVSTEIDDKAVQMIAEWIKGLPPKGEKKAE
ncbi:MAG: hypothetical protein U0835_20215 [Isosphaeraceae bacterium]